MEQRVEINRLIDGAGLNRVNVGMTIFAFCVMLLDGYDISTLAFAAPSIAREWGLSGKGVLGPVFSASLIGMFVGSPLFGWLGDRGGRKVAVAIACVIIGLSSLATASSGMIWELVIFRFLTGLGMGGLAPNMITLVAEYAPKRFRATMVILMYTGITLGGAVAGGVAAWLLASHSWRVLFLIGGVGPLLIAAAVLLLMPESIKFLTVRRSAHERVGRLLSRLTGQQFPASASFYLDEPGKVEPGRTVSSPVFLFKDGLAPVTLSLWLCKCMALMGYYFLMNWSPSLLEQAHVLPKTAALATAVFQVGGTIGGLVLSRLIDQRGVGAITMLFAGAVPVLCCIGYLTGIMSALFVAMFLIGFCALGIQFGLNAVASIVYPTYCRAYALGWTFAVGRIGAIAGPIVGGVIIELNVGIREVFMVAAIPYLLGALGSLKLGGVYGRMLDERAEDEQAEQMRLKEA